MESESASVSVVRALLTEAERQAVRGDEDLSQNQISTYVARVKQRMDAMREDADLLREHRPDVYERLHEAVCEEDIDTRVERLEEQVETLQAELEQQEEE